MKEIFVQLCLPDIFLSYRLELLISSHEEFSDKCFYMAIYYAFIFCQ